MNDDYSFYTGPRRINRRGFIRDTGSLVALGSLPAYLNASTAAVSAGIDGLLQDGGIVLYRQEDAHSVAFASMLANANINAVALGDDPVRQWRDGLDKKSGATGIRAKVPLIGLTSWPDYLLISGMASEQRQHVLLHMQHHVSSTMQETWAAKLAGDYLQLPTGADRPVLSAFADRHTQNQAVKPGERTLFSWLIA